VDEWVSIGGALVGAIVGGVLAMVGAAWAERRSARTASQTATRAIFWEVESNRQRLHELQSEALIGGGTHSTAFKACFVTLAREVPDDHPLMLQLVVDAYRECEIVEASIEQGRSSDVTRRRAGKAAEACLHASREMSELDLGLPWPIRPGEEDIEMVRGSDHRGLDRRPFAGLRRRLSRGR